MVIGELRRELAAVTARNTALAARNAELEKQSAELQKQLRVVVERVDKVERENAELKRKVTGRTTERRGRRRKANPREKNDEEAKRKRREAREQRKANTPTETVPHPVDPASLESCPSCGGEGPVAQLPPDTSSEYEWQPGGFVRLVHERERYKWKCCDHFVRAPAPARVVDGGHYGPGFIAHVVVSKLLDSLPLHRQVKIFKRQGVHVARSTLVDLFHRAASLIEPIYNRMMELVPTSRAVYADETSMKMQRVKKLGYIWTFATLLFVTYVFSPSRSGRTPERVLGDSPGLLVVDGYTGYNTVTVPGRRKRCGCNAHARRKFTNIGDDEVVQVLDYFDEVFAVEREAKQLGIRGSPEHLAMRHARSRPAMDAIKAWCEEHREDYAPKGPVGEAIRYFLNQWEYLTRFLDHAEIDPDNNLSERMLRLMALGRKNYLFVGHENAGQNSAMLSSLLMTCVLHGVNPVSYLADVLIRVQDHPASRIDDLLPHRWKHLFGPGARDGEPSAA